MPTRDEVEALTVEVRLLAEAIEKERDAKKAAQTTVRRYRVLFAGVILLLVAGLFRANNAANNAQDAAVKAQAAVDEVVAQRTEARANTCDKDKRFAEAHNALVARDKALVLAIATDAGRHTVSPENQAPLDHELAEYDKQLVEVPDCSPEGIKAFYEKDR